MKKPTKTEQELIKNLETSIQQVSENHYAHCAKQELDDKTASCTLLTALATELTKLVSDSTNMTPEYWGNACATALAMYKEENNVH